MLSVRHLLTCLKARFAKALKHAMLIGYVFLQQKKAQNNSETFVWTSQGLNLGPPDYESVALTN